MSDTRTLEKKLKTAAGMTAGPAQAANAAVPCFAPSVSYSRSPVNGPAKFDGDKLRLELIPPEFLQATARGLGYGAKKYAPGNWATGKGLDHSRLYGALQRHLTAYWSGEDVDAESGNCHLDHAACMLAFLIAGRERKLGEDDRVSIGVAKP